MVKLCRKFLWKWKKRRERGFEWLSGLPFLLLLLHWDPFDASSAPVKARAQLDRDQFYSKLQHLIKGLACPREKISSRKGPLSKGKLAWCVIWFKEVKFKTVKWMIFSSMRAKKMTKFGSSAFETLIDSPEGVINNKILDFFCITLTKKLLPPPHTHTRTHTHTNTHSLN